MPITNAAGDGPYRQSGYVRMADGARLRYTVVRPSAVGRYPVVMTYTPYGDGSDPTGSFSNAPGQAANLAAHGFAVLGVAVRGSNCSSGSFGFLDPQEVDDGAAMVEWAAAQPWSTGHVGMFTTSYAGATALLVAARRPPHLDAIAPGQVGADLYRDLAYPGGIRNLFIQTYLLGLQPSFSAGGAVTGVAQGDARCVGNFTERLPSSMTNSMSAIEHPFADAYWAARSPGTFAASIEVPMLATTTWQDDTFGSRSGSFYFDQLDPRKLWLIGSNGRHGMFDVAPVYLALERRFFERFLIGARNGFDLEPHVQLWHDTTESLDIAPTASWISTAPLWPLHPHATTLHLGPDGELTTTRRSGSPDTYAYPLPSASAPNPEWPADSPRWAAGDAPGGALTYTSAPLARDEEFFGPGSVDVWLASTASDADVQVTLTEIRPEGQEQYVQRGWLRMSRRKLDPARSTVLRPFQTHQPGDVAPLVPNQPTPARIELFPFDHVFRAGSRIRLIVDAPTGATGYWSWDYVRQPSINSILHDDDHDSRLVLGLIPGGHAAQPSPACDTLVNQPCRPTL